jgi:hypothetical protein
MGEPMQNRLVAVAGAALFAVASVAGCAQQQTVPRQVARVTIDGGMHATRAPRCSQLQSYRTIDIGDDDAGVEAVVLVRGNKVIPQWVKIRNYYGFTGSFWEGGVGDANADIARTGFTITGSAYGIKSDNPNKVTTTDFKITADC